MKMERWIIEGLKVMAAFCAGAAFSAWLYG